MQFFFEVLIGGLLSGVMYSLVALGFVLIYKASGVFNFAQGSMVFFAALTFVGLMEKGVGFWLSLPLTLLVSKRGSSRNTVSIPTSTASWLARARWAARKPSSLLRRIGSLANESSRCPSRD